MILNPKIKSISGVAVPLTHKERQLFLLDIKKVKC